MPRKFKTEPPPLNLGDETIGQRISRIRKERGFTQEELGKRMGISNYLVSAYEIGRLNINAKMLTRFCLALNVSSDELLGLNTHQKKEEKYNYKILQRLLKIERLPSKIQKSILQNIDLIIQGVEKK